MHDTEDLPERDIQVPGAEDDEIEISDLEPGTRRLWRLPRLTRWQRRLSLTLTAGLALLAVALILLTVPGLTSLAGQAFFPAMPTLSPGSSAHIYLQSNPDWGHFSVDGKTVGTTNLASPLVLGPGKHTISWQAPPFRGQSCTLQITNTGGITGCDSYRRGIETAFTMESCPQSTNLQKALNDCNTYQQSIQQSGPPPSLALLFFTVSINDLPVQEQTALTEQIQYVLASQQISEAVQAGESYAVSPCNLQPDQKLPLCMAQASEPLKATPHLSMSIAPNNQCQQASVCSDQSWQLCSDASCRSVYQTGHTWNVTLVGNLTWNLTTPAGQVVASNQPDSFLTQNQNDQENFSLQITYDGQGWHVSNPDLANMVCQLAQADFLNVAGILQPKSSVRDMSIIKGAAPQVDCLLLASSLSSADDKNEQSWLLERFGVLVAANDRAHALYPALPLADAQEEIQVQKLLSSM